MLNCKMNDESIYSLAEKLIDNLENGNYTENNIKKYSTIAWYITFLSKKKL